MASLVLNGNTSGSVTISSPAVSGTTTITLPTVSGGNFVVSDSNGNVGIGTTSPAYLLDVQSGSTAVDYIAGRFISTAAGTGESHTWLKLEKGSTYGGAVGGYLNQGVGGGLLLGTQSGSATPTERMRIDSNGNVLVGVTSVNLSGSGVSITTYSNGRYIDVGHTSGDTGGEGYVRFVRNGSLVGQIASNGTTQVTYSTSSDYRLKDNIVPMTGALDKVAQLKPVTYTWKSDGSDGQGFIAHELQAVVPDCVTGEKDAVDAEGNPVYQGVDTSFLVATLTAAIQEQQTIIESLKTDIAALKAKVGE